MDQETLGWDESSGKTYSQRSKEEAHDYRYFPEPDLPPLVVETAWVERIRTALPELPQARLERFVSAYQLTPYDAAVLVEEAAVADYFEAVVRAAGDVPARTAALWITGEVFAWMKQRGALVEQLKMAPAALGELLKAVAGGQINQNTGKAVLGQMLESGQSAAQIIQARGLQQISDGGAITAMVRQALQDNPSEVASYLAGKETLANWFFGQVMRGAGGKANPQVVRAELERQLSGLKKT